MLDQYPWYQVVDDTQGLEQGDLLFNCPVLLPIWKPSKEQLSTDEKYQIKGEVTFYDVVIMSQTCDLVNNKLKFALVCPHWSIEEFEESDLLRHKGRKARKSIKEKIRRGEAPNYHMLAACQIEEYKHSIRIIDFRQVFSLPIDLISHIAIEQSPRLRLMPPYREHLAQAFARFFMRVGLPVDIPPFR